MKIKYICDVVELHKAKNNLASGNADDKKNLHPGGREFIFLTNLFEFFEQSLHLKNYTNSKEPYFSLFREIKNFSK